MREYERQLWSDSPSWAAGLTSQIRCSEDQQKKSRRRSGIVMQNTQTEGPQSPTNSFTNTTNTAPVTQPGLYPGLRSYQTGWQIFSRPINPPLPVQGSERSLHRARATPFPLGKMGRATMHLRLSNRALF